MPNDVAALIEGDDGLSGSVLVGDEVGRGQTLVHLLVPGRAYQGLLISGQAVVNLAIHQVLHRLATVTKLEQRPGLDLSSDPGPVRELLIHRAAGQKRSSCRGRIDVIVRTVRVCPAHLRDLLQMPEAYRRAELGPMYRVTGSAVSRPVPTRRLPPWQGEGKPCVCLPPGPTPSVDQMSHLWCTVNPS